MLNLGNIKPVPAKAKTGSEKKVESDKSAAKSSKFDFPNPVGAKKSVQKTATATATAASNAIDFPQPVGAKNTASQTSKTVTAIPSTTDFPKPVGAKKVVSQTSRTVTAIPSTTNFPRPVGAEKALSSQPMPAATSFVQPPQLSNLVTSASHFMPGPPPAVCNPHFSQGPVMFPSQGPPFPSIQPPFLAGPPMPMNSPYPPYVNLPPPYLMSVNPYYNPQTSNAAVENFSYPVSYPNTSKPMGQQTKLNADEAEKLSLEEREKLTQEALFPPGRTAELQSLFEQYPDRTFIGLEYFIEIHNNTVKKTPPSYHCILCNMYVKVKDEKTFSSLELAKGHLKSSGHKLKYLSEHFPKVKALRWHGSNNAPIPIDELNSTIDYIVKQFGFMKIKLVIGMKLFKRSLAEIKIVVDNSTHFREDDLFIKSFCTFFNIGTSHEKATKRSSRSTSPRGEPKKRRSRSINSPKARDKRYSKSKDRKRSMEKSDSKYSKSRSRSRSRDRQRRKRRSRLRSQDRSRSRGRDKSRNRKDHRYNSRSSSRSSSSSGEGMYSSKDKRVMEFLKQEEILKEEINALKEDWLSHAEDHPDYDVQWSKFYKKKCDEFGVSKIQPEYVKDEWEMVWKKYFQSLLDRKAKEKKNRLFNIYKLLREDITNFKKKHPFYGLKPQTAEKKKSPLLIDLAQETYDRKKTYLSPIPGLKTVTREEELVWMNPAAPDREKSNDSDIYGPKSNLLLDATSNWEARNPSPTPMRQEPKLWNNAGISKDSTEFQQNLGETESARANEPPRVLREVVLSDSPTKNPVSDDPSVTVIGTLRLLSAIERLIGGLGSRVNDALAKASSYDRNYGSGSSKALVDSKEFYDLIDLVGEKLKVVKLLGKMNEKEAEVANVCIRNINVLMQRSICTITAADKPVDNRSESVVRREISDPSEKAVKAAIAKTVEDQFRKMGKRLTQDELPKVVEAEYQRVKGVLPMSALISATLEAHTKYQERKGPENYARDDVPSTSKNVVGYSDNRQLGKETFPTRTSLEKDHHLQDKSFSERDPFATRTSDSYRSGRKSYEGDPMTQGRNLQSYERKVATQDIGKEIGHNFQPGGNLPSRSQESINTKVSSTVNVSERDEHLFGTNPPPPNIPAKSSSQSQNEIDWMAVKTALTTTSSEKKGPIKLNLLPETARTTQRSETMSRAQEVPNMSKNVSESNLTRTIGKTESREDEPSLIESGDRGLQRWNQYPQFDKSTYSNPARSAVQLPPVGPDSPATNVLHQGASRQLYQDNQLQSTSQEPQDGGNIFEDLTVDELASLFQNFKELDKESKEQLIEYMKKLEKSDQRKVTELKLKLHSSNKRS